MILRAVGLGVVCSAILFAIASGDAQAARKAARGAPRCMEAVVPKCNYPQFFYCAKKSKCGSCAKWTCRAPGAPHA
jgi:hypothetical protein